MSSDDALGGFPGLVRRHQLASFVCLGFGWSWGVFFLVIRPLGWVGLRRAQVAFAWGPLIGAALVTKLAGLDVREWASQVTRLDVAPRWYLYALVTPLALTDGGRVLAWVIGGDVALVDAGAGEYLYGFAVTLFLAGSLEEFGWRGFAQPRLQERRSALTGALAIGLLWALWHLPLAYGGAGAGYDAGAFASLLIGLPLFSVAMAWIYNGSGGSLPCVMLFHATINAPSPLALGDGGPDWIATVAELATLALLIGVPVGIVVRYGGAYLAESRPDPRVPGASE